MRDDVQREEASQYSDAGYEFDGGDGENSPYSYRAGSSTASAITGTGSDAQTHRVRTHRWLRKEAIAK